MTTVLAISNQKGGVGKSTSARALGDALATAGERVVLVDCDHQASLTLLTGLDLRQATPHLGDALRAALAQRDPLLSDYFLALTPNEVLVPGHISLAGLDMELVTARGGDWFLRDLLDPVRALTDWVLLDCPPSLSMLTVNALHAADAVLIPTVPDLVSSQGLGELITTMRGQIDRTRRRAHLPPLVVAGVFLTKVRAHLGAHQNHRAALAAFCSGAGVPFLSAPTEAARSADPDAWIEIPDTISVVKAADAGQPVTRWDTNGARSGYHRLAAYLQERFPHAT